MRKSPQADVFRPCGSDQNAHIHGRAFAQRKNQLHRRAHEEIQTHMQLEPYDRKTYGLSLYCPDKLYSEQGTEKFSPQPISARFDRGREAEKRPAGTFSHVSAGRTKTARKPFRSLSFSAEGPSCGLCHRGQRSCEATPGECSAFSVGHLRGGPAARAGPPRCPAHSGYNRLQRLSLCFLNDAAKLFTRRPRRTKKSKGFAFQKRPRAAPPPQY